MTIPEPTYDPRVQSYTATVCGKPVYGPTRAACNDRIYEVLGNRRRFLQHDPTAADLLDVASLSPLDGGGGAVLDEAAPPEPLFKGAPERALRDMTEQEIRDLTSDEFMAAQLEDNCVGCPEAPRSTCSLRMHCEAKAYGVGDGSD